MKEGHFGPGWWPKYQKDLKARVKVVLDQRGVSVALMVGYYSFALQVDKAKREGLRGYTLSEYCRGLVSMSLERRLEREVMEAILQGVFCVNPEHVRPKGYEEKAEGSSF